MAKKIAEERIERLFELADKRLKGSNKDLADRYVELARRIGMKHRVSIPTELKKRYCDECHSFLKPGANCTVRINSENKTVIYACEECGGLNRYGF